MKKLISSFIVIATLAGCFQNANDAKMKTTRSSSDSTVKTDPGGRESLPANSIYQLADSFQTQDAKPFLLTMLQGKPTVMGMIFTHCTYACPRLTADIESIADSLRDKSGMVNFVLVSFDTRRDTAGQLKIFANKMGLNKNWILLHGSEDAVRSLSILLNIQFEKNADGDFSHSNIVSVLDTYGVLQFQKEGLGVVHTETINSIRKLLN